MILIPIKTQQEIDPKLWDRVSVNINMECMLINATGLEFISDYFPFEEYFLTEDSKIQAAIIPLYKCINTSHEITGIRSMDIDLNAISIPHVFFNIQPSPYMKSLYETDSSTFNLLSTLHTSFPGIDNIELSLESCCSKHGCTISEMNNSAIEEYSSFLTNVLVMTKLHLP